MTDVYMTIKPYQVTLSHIWNTSILKTIEAYEQRSALFTWPRLRIKYNFKRKEFEDSNWLRRQLIQEGKGIWAVPIWSDLTKVSSQAASGQKEINVNATSNRHFYEGRDIIIINASNWGSYEVAIIDTGGIASTKLTVTENLTNTWSVDSLVLPLYDCRINMKTDIQKIFDKYEMFSMTFDEAYEETRSFTYSIPSSGADTYQDLDMFELSPALPVEYEYYYPYEMTNFLGLNISDYDYIIAESSLKLTFRKSERSDIWEILNFFDSKLGRYDKFWLPSFHDDIVVNTAFANTDDELIIDDIEYPDFWLDNTVIGRYLYIEFPDNTITQKQITDCTDSDPTTIVLDSAIGKTVTTSELNDLKISFLYLCRFDVDEIEIEYIEGNYLAIVSLPFKVLINESVA